MPKHKSEDFKMSAVEYYLTEDVSQEQVCRIGLVALHDKSKTLQCSLLFTFRHTLIH